MGKRFPEEFQRIDKVKSNDKLLIHDSEDGIDKYATPSQFNASLNELSVHYEDAIAAKEAAVAAQKAAETAESGAKTAVAEATKDAVDAATAQAVKAQESAGKSESSAGKSASSAASAKEYSDSIKNSVDDLNNIKVLDDRLTTLLGYCEKRTVVNLEQGVSGKYVQCESRSAVANAAFAISKPFDVDACSELLIKTGFNPSDASHKGLDLSVIAIYEQIERQRTVQKKNPDGQLLYYVVTTDAETGNQTVTQDETTEDTGYPVYTVETYTETRYLPNNEDRFVAIPDSGYYVANIPQSCKVVISYKPGISDTAVIIEKHGAIANLISQVFGIYEHRAMVECMVSLEARIKAIEQSRGLLGNATAGTLDVSELTKCKYPMTLFGHGVPAEATKPTNLPEGLPWDGCPMFKGQMYINLDAASGGLYYAVSVDSVNGWRQA